ncbi:hypothetical protein BDZ89DRAFT_1199907 [Hymenopellis radicata]|nr:hypothetical protein BDZ89DRAFT_1199907 [Hymenopellis radicata]
MVPAKVWRATVMDVLAEKCSASTGVGSGVGTLEDRDLKSGQLEKTRAKTTHHFSSQNTKFYSSTRCSSPSLLQRVRMSFEDAITKEKSQLVRYSWSFQQRKSVPNMCAPLIFESPKPKTSSVANFELYAKKGRSVVRMWRTQEVRKVAGLVLSYRREPEYGPEHIQGRRMETGRESCTQSWRLRRGRLAQSHRGIVQAAGQGLHCHWQMPISAENHSRLGFYRIVIESAPQTSITLP